MSKNISKNVVPFWEEGMDNDMRCERIKSLFAELDQNSDLRTVANNNALLYVFVPNPPPMAFSADFIGDSGVIVNWGRNGLAAYTKDRSAAEVLAPKIFDLWPDSLLVIMFEDIGGSDLGELISNVSTGNTLDLPRHKVIVFDWGDRVVES